MTRDDDPPSKVQVAWESVANKLRKAVAARIDDVPALNPEEITKLVEATRNVFWFEINVRSMDHLINLEHQRTGFE